MNCAAPVANTTLQLRGLSKRYEDSVAVDSVDLNLQAGESLAIIGHNGAGKTTLMKLILQLIRPSSGTITRYAVGDSGRPAAQEQNHCIGFLPESVVFSPTLTGRQMLRFYARLKRCSFGECESLLELVGLSAAAGNKINTYSKGMRQRLGLAQALLGEPNLLLLDEPTSGLDPMARTQFYDIVAQRQAAGTSVILSSHALTEIEARTDRIAIMKAGRIVTQGSLSALRAQAAMPVRIGVTLREGFAEGLIASLDSDCVFASSSATHLEICCAQELKLVVLHQLTARQDAVVDLLVRPPGLDDLYAHFVAGDAP